MKTIFLILLGLLPAMPFLAQTPRIETLKQELASTSGITRFQKLIALSEACLDAGAYKEADGYAGDADDLAAKLQLPEMRALALNRDGKALMALGKKGLFGRDKAASRFRQSNDLLRDDNSLNKGLALDNYDNLRQLAKKGGRDNEVIEIDAMIDRMKKGGSIGQEKNLTRKDLHQEISTLKEEIARQQTATQQEISRQNKDFLAVLQTKENAINQMTEAQMKSELVLMQQRQMLDSLSYHARMDSLSLSNRTYALKEAQSSRNLVLAILGILVLLAGGLTYGVFKARQNALILSEKNKIIREEQKRSEELLLNILPALVADELKKKGRTNARFFADVSVLFADFIGFSKIAEQLSPQQLVTELDTCFQAFDAIIARYKIEKIKTIGDAYMCAGGLPNGGGSQLRDMIAAAREMQQWLSDWNHERQAKGLPRFDARIGIHNGPVVAGVVGSKKFAFDIWGDTVNIAARVEQAGESGKINISGAVFEVVREYFPCEYRGKIAVKNKGEIDMYFVGN
jgi:class 3 adenylate cyclase